MSQSALNSLAAQMLNMHAKYACRVLYQFPLLSDAQVRSIPHWRGAIWPQAMLPRINLSAPSQGPEYIT